MKSLVIVALIALSLAGCSSRGSTASNTVASLMSEDEKHRLYSAALAASESPLDSDTFKDVCKRIGIFDGDGKPNDKYMAFVAQHVDWCMKPETEQFRQEINSREKAKGYVTAHLPH